MTSPSTSPAQVFWLETDQHLELLGDPTRLEVIECLFTPATVGELAEQMAVPRTRLYHHINLLEAAGMIRVVGTRQAGARTERIYQVAAYGFKPSKRYLRRAMPKEQAQAVLQAIFASTEADFIRSVEMGKAPLQDPRQARRTHLGRRLMLMDRVQLHQFISELEELFGRYDVDPLPSGPVPEDQEVVAVLSMVYPSARRLPSETS
jgi:DNA-binding transcriptional ArsR family regulator